MGEIINKKDDIEQAVWQEITEYAQGIADNKPMLSSLMYMKILSHKTFADALVHIITDSLKTDMVLQSNLEREFHRVIKENPQVIEYALKDLQAVKDRDPACEQFATPLLHFKGFKTIQAHRVSHELWNSGDEGDQEVALFLQSRMSEAYGVDIHPGAVIGHGFMLDHATSVVIGETAVVGNNVSMLHGVTLGGTGTSNEHKRHPTIGNGALLGAGCKVLGNILVGDNAKVAASSVVLKGVEPSTTVAGIPAKVVCGVSGPNPSERMDHSLNGKFGDATTDEGAAKLSIA